MGPADDKPTNDKPADEHDHSATEAPSTPEANTPPADAPEQPAPPMPTADQLKVKDTKKYGITGLQKEVLQNYLTIQQLNQFQLRAHLQMLGESEWGIKADQFTRFGLNLEQNEVTVEFLEPAGGAPANGSAPGLEAAPPAPAQ